ncbi:hypothetical protein K457DRAFT_123163 [Linnemannia elongata AG-77]|uniref:F-box domain-containing protein n=1 Tax=Linnemannia elongata AG-77 TaxID=1314771 RepID=A0A197K4V2_9FUNG|nr:hypothetical protein K457DRAFT_123163 [Linnemannia elongata AG-77]
MAFPATTKKVFELPELTHRLSRFVTVQDAISCALVSKAWTEHFISVIWFKIDFDVHPRFLNLSPDIVAKHGHHIRIIVDAKTLPQVSILANSGVNGLRDLKIETAASASQHVRAYEIVFRNNHSLEDLNLTAINTTVSKQDSTAHYVPVSALIPSLGSSSPTLSKLQRLRIQNMCLTHDSLAFVLQGCPRLSQLRLSFTDVVGTPTQSFQHAGVKVFGSTLKSIFPDEPTGTSLLSYFPGLTTLSTYNYGSSHSIPSARIKDDITRYCPHLSGYHLEDSTGAIVLNFLTDIANNMSEIVCLLRHISSETITAMLLHQATLKIVKHFNFEQDFDFEKEEIAKVGDHLQLSGRFLQLIPRCCPDLEELRLFGHEMDMDVVEQGKWVCHDLKTLRIRIKGLDTKEKILKAIALWRKGCWRRWRKNAGTSVAAEDEEDETDMSIEARVARHLLKFDKLWWVWLGYQTWTPI